MRILVLCTLLGYALAIPKSSSRIVGGSIASIEQYPYVTNMQYAVRGIWWYQACGGSLLNSYTILSAAHCYFGDSSSNWRAVLGTSLEWGGEGDTHLVSQIVIHETFSPNTLENDIAILHLVNPAYISRKVGYGRVAGPNYIVQDGAPVTALGWGALYNGGPFSEELQQVETAIINRELCAERYAYLKTQIGYTTIPDVTTNMICTGILDEGGRDTCEGDSGNPVVEAGDAIVGITSWSANCADRYYPSVITRVSVYTDWIFANIK